MGRKRGLTLRFGETTRQGSVGHGLEESKREDGRGAAKTQTPRGFEPGATERISKVTIRPDTTAVGGLEDGGLEDGRPSSVNAKAGMTIIGSATAKRFGDWLYLGRAIPTSVLGGTTKGGGLTTWGEGGIELEETGCCRLCMEDGKKRECCKQEYCDHCYGTRQTCPNCGVRLDHGVPILKHDDDELADKAVLECRRCLKQGYRRKCCQEYYCNDCYFMTGFCPSCHAPVAKTGMTERPPIPDPGFWPVAASYGISGAFVLLVLSISAFFIANDVRTPRTVQGFTCYGMLPTCGAPDTCVKWDADAVGDGTASEGLEAVPNMTSWQACSLQDPLRIEGPVCIFDPELYRLSNQTLGYDFCKTGFQEGVTYFQDDFEYWTNSTGYKTQRLKAANWARIVNGQANWKCGSANGNKSLHFSGSDYRYAQTQPMNVQHGAVIKFKLRFGSPEEADLIYTECKPAYGGNVRVLWSKDLVTWKTIGEYTPAVFNKNRFYDVQIDVPKAAWSNATSFKWMQSEFTNIRDHWAIDRVRVIHTFPLGWEQTSVMRKVKAATRNYIDNVQCCYRTMQCQVWRLDKPMSGCEALPLFNPTDKPLHGAELLVVVALVVSVVRSLYTAVTSSAVVEWIEKMRRTRKIAADKPPPGLLTGEFSPRMSPRWQALASVVAVLPFLAMVALDGLYASQQPYTLVQSHQALGSYGGASVAAAGAVEVRTPLMLVYAMAVYLDLKDVFQFLARVVCVVPCMVPSISIDATPQVSLFQIGGDKFALEDVSEITRFSLQYCWAMAARMLLGVQPYALLLLCLGLTHPNFPTFRILRWVVFFATVLKAFYGPEWLVKLTWGLVYLLSQDARNRDEFGNQLLTRRIWWLALYWALVSGLTGVVTLAIVKDSWAGGGLIVCAVAGALFGFMLGVAEGLPVVPCFLLTTLDTGVYVRVTRRKEVPCLYRCRHWKTIHERDEIVVVFVDEDFRMVSLLKGVPPPGAAPKASGVGDPLAQHNA